MAINTFEQDLVLSVANQNAFNNILRIGVAGIAGLVITGLLFLLMQKLIAPQHKVIVEPPKVPPIEVVMIEPKEHTIIKQPVKLEPPKPVKAPEKPVSQPLENTAIDVNVAVDVPNINLPNSTTSINTGIPTEGDAKPIIRIEPQYPMDAARKGIEGWVELTFSILADGRVGDVRIKNAEPKRIFDNAAKKALKRWKYKAKIENGKAVIQQGLSIRLDFTMQ
ncbi:TonB family protein [Catenovulum sp. SM1970]|uniref:TonB family protein n=1 Tax=Marinifaba aquimaris TaxID=2741323 RepID=UPI0015722E16|nr:TonB family protein [Marinifaba aquimaris]NTS77761.1 TonB family protein [Marinifaba aquimaris]